MLVRNTLLILFTIIMIVVASVLHDIEENIQTEQTKRFWNFSE